MNNEIDLEKPDIPASKENLLKKSFEEFEKELADLINRHSLEYTLAMPDFMLAKLLTNILKQMFIAHFDNDKWHGMEAYPENYKEKQS